MKRRGRADDGGADGRVRSSTRGALFGACLIACLGLGSVGQSTAAGSTLLSGFQDTVVPFEGLEHSQGLEEPTSVRFSQDGHVFVAEKAGEILVYDSLSDTTPTLFADLRTEVYDNGDRGILGLALDPKFPERPYVYVLYTYDHILGEEGPAPKWGEPNKAGDPCPKPEGADVDACPVSGRLVRLTAEGDHAVEKEGVPAEKVLAEGWCQQFSSHSIGDLQFDSEGALYASGGEGASFTSPDYGQFGWPDKNQCGDPPGKVGEALSPPTAEGGSLRSQSLDNLSGKVIRIDPETGEGLPENPMATSPNANARRIVAYGFRNPFRFAIDPQTHEVYVDNVGAGDWEEMDRFAGTPSQAYNSGWPCYEGPNSNPGFRNLELDVCKRLYNEPGSTSRPFFSYNHAEGVTPEDPCPISNGSAVTGITFYNGGSFPSSYDNALFFADSIRGCIYVMFPGEDGRPDPSTVTPFLTDGGLDPGVDLEVGPEGDLYYVSLFGDEYGPGSIHRISYSSGNQPPVAHLTVDQPWGASPLEVHFNASSSTDADEEPLEYEWDLNGDGIFESPTPNSTVTETFEDEKNHTVAVRVTDKQGASSVARVTVYPGDTPPKPEVLKPEESGPESEAGFKWRVGQPIDFEGKAQDIEDGELASTSLGWNSRLYHCPSACHVHPLQAFPAVDSGTLIAPDHDYPSHIELTLTATDSRGLAATKTVQIYPHTVELNIDSEPPGLTLTAGLLTQPGPFSVQAIEGSHITLAAPQTVEVGGKTYTWNDWSDGGARVHTIVAESSAGYTASYSTPEIPSPPLGTPPSLGDTTPPQTSLVKHPKKSTSKSTATFAFSSSEVDSSFRCKLDQKPFKPCRSPKKYRHLRSKSHVFEVAAVDASGNVDSTPVTFRWKVKP